MDDTGVPQAAIEQVPSAFDDADDARVLLDVREDDEWRGGAAPRARPHPMSDIPARMAEIPPDAELFVVCHAGGRSQRVAQYLARNGYRPVNVSGGMLAWAGAGRPVVTDDGGTGAV
jgi:rhodanese-related sulfurtransferase